MALYHQLKFPSTFIEYRCVSEWKGVVVFSNFDSLEAAPFKSTALGSCLVCLGLNSPLVFSSLHPNFIISDLSVYFTVGTGCSLIIISPTPIIDIRCLSPFH